MLKEVARLLKNYLLLARFKSNWRKHNTHNNTHANMIFPVDKVKIGKGTYGPLNIHSFGHPEEQLKIGNYCSIAHNVIFCLSGEHDLKKISTYPFHQISNKHRIVDVNCKGKIIVEDDVWLGMNCTVLSGVHIGQGAVIGAGSVIARDIPPYSIVINGKVAKYRFGNDIIEELVKIDYQKIQLSNIEILNFLNTNVDNLSLEEIRKYVNIVRKDGN